MIGALIGAGVGLIGSSMAADAQRDSASMQADAAKFRPYNVTTGLGKVNFGDQSVDYTLDPRLRDYQNRMFDLGASGIPTSINPDEAVQGLFNKYQQLAAPVRERSFNMLQNSQFNNGTLGLSMGATTADAGGYGNSNPALSAWLEQQNMADQKMFLQAQDSARNYMDSDLKRATGLFGQAIGVEGVGTDLINTGAMLGGRQADAGANMGRLMANGFNNATQLETNAIGGIVDMVTRGAKNTDWGNVGTSIKGFFGGGQPTQVSNAPVNNGSSGYWYGSV